MDFGNIIEKNVLKNGLPQPGTVTHFCNLSYLGGAGEDHCSRPAQAKKVNDAKHDG
jgi:hypothetical protein